MSINITKTVDPQHDLDIFQSYQHNNIVAVKQFIQNGGDVNLRNEFTSSTGIHYAANNGNLEMCQMLIDAKADLTLTNVWGDTALHYAACSGDVDVCRLFVKTCIQSRNAFSKTPLHAAAHKGHASVCQLLIDNDIDIHALDGSGCSAFSMASQRDIHIEVCEVLFRAELTRLQSGGPSLKCSWFDMHTAASFGQIDVCRFLMKNGAKADEPNMRGETPLHYAAMNGHSKTCDALITEGNANVNSQDRLGFTALHQAAAYENVETCKLLITKEANLNIETKDGDTPLNLAAVVYGNIEVSQLLIENGAIFKNPFTFGSASKKALFNKLRQTYLMKQVVKLFYTFKIPFRMSDKRSDYAILGFYIVSDNLIPEVFPDLTKENAFVVRQTFLKMRGIDEKVVAPEDRLELIVQTKTG